jgi:hypothetical protein
MNNQKKNRRFSKEAQEKVANRYVVMYQKYSNMSNEDLNLEISKKKSSTDSLALRDAIMYKVEKERIEQVNKEVSNETSKKEINKGEDNSIKIEETKSE